MLKHVLPAVAIAFLAANLLAASPKGLIPPDLAEKLDAVFVTGTKPEQVRALCGDPEFTNQFNADIVVWRYISGDKYVLFAFEKGALKQITRRNVVAEPPKPPAPSMPVDGVNRASRTTWHSFYSERGAALGAKIGFSKVAALEALAAHGIPSHGVECEVDASQSNVEVCHVEPNGLEWRQIDPSQQDWTTFALYFEDGRLRATMHFVAFPDLQKARATQAEIRAALAAAFQKPAEKLGFWRRKLSSMALPMASIAEGAKWEDGVVTGAVARGTFGPSGQQVPALLVVVSEKDPE